MDEQIRFRVAEAPTGGGRVAWSYLGTLLAALVATLLWAAWSPFSGAACGPDNPVCELGWNIVGWLGAMVLALGLPAAVLRLGWEWWAVLAALLLGSPLWFDTVPDWLRIVVTVLAPALAAAATWSGPRRPAWRPWVVAALAVAVVVLGLLSILL